MSGPKAYQYTVDDAIALRRQRLDQSRGECAALESRTKSLQEQIVSLRLQSLNVTATLVSTLPAGPGSANESLDTWERYQALLRDWIRKAQALVDRACMDEALAALFEQVGYGNYGSAEKVRYEISNPERRSATTDSVRHVPPDHTRRRPIVEQTLRGIEATVSAETRAEIEKSFKVFLTASSDEIARQWQEDVCHRVAAANYAARQRRAQADEAHVLLDAMRGLGCGPGIKEIQEELHAVCRGERELSESLREEAERETLRARRDAHAAYVKQVMQETFRGLGYEVHTSPVATALPRAGALLVRKPAWGDYYVRVMPGANAGELNCHLVRFGEAQGEHRDFVERKEYELETRWCADLPKAITAMGERGVMLKLLRQLSAGKRPAVRLSVSEKPETSAAAIELGDERDTPLTRHL